MAGSRLPEEGDELGVFAEINITPLTDIFLVLLIIFMVGAAMAVDAASGRAGDVEGGVKIDLPKGSAKEIAPRSQDVAVAVLADGRVLIEGVEVSADELERKLAEARGGDDDATLILQADEGVAHGRVVQVMERARAAGYARLAVATRGE